MLSDSNSEDPRDFCNSNNFVVPVHQAIDGWERTQFHSILIFEQFILIARIRRMLMDSSQEQWAIFLHSEESSWPT